MTLLLAFFLSGCAALLFETLWFRQAGLLLGNSVWASSLVLAAFMAGLGTGNALAARFGGRVRRPLLAYALIEVLVGVTGVGLVLGFPLLPRLLSPLLRGSGFSLMSLNLVRMAASFGLMVIPAAAMGATLPILLRARDPEEPIFGRSLGRLYGWNTLGAVVGALGGEALLVPALGQRGTGALAGLLNLAAAGLALRYEVRSPTSAPPAEPPAARPSLAAEIPLLVAAFLAGGAFLSLEVVWFRLLSLFCVGTSLTFAIMLSVVLAGIAIGSLGASHWLKLRPEAADLGWLAAISAGAFVVLTYASFAGTADALPGLVSDEGTILRLSLLLMLPVSALSGILFTLLGQALKTRLSEVARAAGTLTLANTAGAAAGSLAGSLVLLSRLGIERSFFALALTYGVVGLILCRRGPRRAGAAAGRRLGVAIPAAAYLVILALFPFGLLKNHLLKKIVAPYTRDGSRVIADRETVTENLVYLRKELYGRPVSHRLITNGFSMSATGAIPGRYMALFAQWGVALNPSVRHALLISFGVGTTAEALVETRSLESIDVVDISKDILELGRLAFPGRAYPLDDPRVTVHVEDGRYFLLTTSRHFDLITAEPPPPRNAGIVNLYSREYFELLRERLSEGGVATYWLPVYQMTSDEARSISAAFCGAFPDCSLWTGGGLEWMLAGTRNAQGPVGAGDFSRQWQDPEVGGRLRARGIESPDALGSLFIADAERLKSWIDGAEPLDDDHPGRLGHGPPAAQARSNAEYWQFMDAERCREAFRRSPFVARLWPGELLLRTLGQFEAQRVVNRVLSQVYGVGLPPGLRDLEWTLTSTNLRTLVLWLMGSDADEEAAALEARARGVREPMLDEILGIGAMADRNYEAAAELLGRAEPFAAHGDRLRKQRVLALGLAQKRDQAADLLRSAQGSMLGAPQEWSDWNWLAKRFALEPPAGIGAVLHETGSKHVDSKAPPG